MEAGLVVMDAGELKLAEAGIERCKSIQYRIRADKRAVEILKERDGDSEAIPSEE